MTSAAPPTFTCKACGASLDGIPEGHPCPACGNTERQNIEGVALVYGLSISFDGLSIFSSHAQVPTWETLWAQIGRRWARLRRMYGVDHGVSNYAEIEDEVDALLTCLNHLGDWLEHDDSLPSFDEMTVRDGITDRWPLALCRDYVNTFKHHTRRATKPDPDPRSARLESTTITVRGQSVQIWYWSKSDPEHAQRIDALDLATKCYDAWREWLTREGALT
jgi:hypothetical protein